MTEILADLVAASVVAALTWSAGTTLGHLMNRKASR
jgi:uncharacterized protein (DUF697 family)